MSDQFERLKTALAGRYEIEREIGQGGMATVYLAHDIRHDREVAVKVLRPDLAAALGTERFLREIKIAANLTHPHILPLHDSGEAEGFLYYVMPYIEGETLRQRIEKEGELPVTEAIRIVREVVDALAFAHSHGVVHRDIKPDNVMLSGRHAMVTDFGVAKAVSEATGRQALTTAGVALGTPAYMAPEQATADPHVDHRADIYAVGALAYELLTGRPPFTGATPQAILAAHVTEQVEPVSKRRDHVSAELEAVVMRCLEKKPADRWQSAEEMLAQLEVLSTPSGGMTPTDTRPVIATVKPKPSRALVAGGAVALLVTVGIALSRIVGGGDAATTAPAAALVEDSRPSVAVLAFADRSSEGNHEYLADGISEAIMDGLFNAGVRVAARTSAFSFKGSDVDIPTIGEQLGVSFVMEGNVLRVGDRIRVSARLISSADGFPVWNDDYDGSFSDVFALQDQVVQSVVGALTDELGIESESAASVSEGVTGSPEAYNSYMLGRFYVEKRTHPGLAAAISHFEDAVAIDSSYALAWAGLADALTLSVPGIYGLEGMENRSGLERAEMAVRRALSINEGLAEAHASLALIHSLRWEWESGEAEFRRSIDLNPTYPTAHHWYALFLLTLGRGEEAWEEISLARQLDPLSLIIGVNYAGAASALGRDAAAEGEFRSLIERLPEVERVHVDYRNHLLQNDMVDQAIEVELTRLRVAGIPVTTAWIDSLREPRTRSELIRSPQDEWFQSFIWLAALGEWDAVLDILEPPADPLDYTHFYLWLRHMGDHHPELAALPRYSAALRRMGLEP